MIGSTLAADRRGSGSSVRALDHVVISSQDLCLAGEMYSRLGFRVLPAVRHIELGTRNRIVQLSNAYIELLGDVAYSIPAVRERMMPRFACGDGISIVSFRSGDLAADRAYLEAVGMLPTPILNARRPIEMPDGSKDETDSRCFYLWRKRRLYGSLFLTQHHKPETIWISAYQQHPNTALRLAALTYVSDHPALDREYFASVIGVPSSLHDEHRQIFSTSQRERIEVLDERALAERYGEYAPVWNRAQPVYGVGLSYEVEDLVLCCSALDRSNIPFTRRGNRVLVAAATTGGVVTEFVQDSDQAGGGPRASFS